MPLEAETHAGEDVPIYASGPGASLLDGVIEQHVLYHVMNLAERLEQRAGVKPSADAALHGR